MKRLKKIADHDADSRDAALVIVGDKVYENATHALCLNDIYKELGEKLYIDLQYRPDIEQFQIISDKKDTSVILAHKVDNYDSIYYFYGYNDGNEMSDSEIESKLQKVFPKYNIKNDLEHELTPEEANSYDYEEKIKDMCKAIDKEIEENGTVDDALEEVGFQDYEDCYLTNGSCVVMSSGNGIYVDRMPDYLQNFENINSAGKVKPQHIEEFLEAVKNEPPSKIGEAFRNHGYEMIDGDKTINFIKRFNETDVQFEISDNEKDFDISYVGDDETEEYLKELIGTLNNIYVTDELLDKIDENLNTFCFAED